jgi:hypothetical protein
MKHCNCLALSHGHLPGQCDEPEPPTGAGVCVTCRYAVNNDVSTEWLVERMRERDLSFFQRQAIKTAIEQPNGRQPYVDEAD